MWAHAEEEEKGLGESDGIRYQVPGMHFALSALHTAERGPRYDALRYIHAYFCGKVKK